MLTFILFVIAGFYLLGLLGRILLRVWIKKQQKKFGEQGNPFFRTYSWGGAQQTKQNSEGEIHVEQTTQKEKKINTSVGDYVDYEEVKEDKTE